MPKRRPRALARRHPLWVRALARSYFCVVAAVAGGDVDVIDVADVIDAGGVGVVVDVAVAAVLAAVDDVAVVDANVSVLAALVTTVFLTSLVSVAFFNIRLWDQDSP